jgi:hypothetical protein
VFGGIEVKVTVYGRRSPIPSRTDCIQIETIRGEVAIDIVNPRYARVKAQSPSEQQ